MSREEVVLLVSRALAVTQGVTALLETSYLPERLFSANHYSHSASVLTTAPNYLGTLYEAEIASLLFRITGLLFLTWLFWRCGPRVARLLFPTNKLPAASE